MSVLQQLNSKGNIRKTSSADLPVQPQYPVTARYEATSTSSQTIINMSFSVDQSNTDAFQLYVDGKLLRSGASNDYTFTSIQSDNTSSQVTLNYSIPANLNIVALKVGTKKESEFNMDNRFVQLYAAQQEGFQPFVKTSSIRTATTGTPSSSQFYSAITNRASIVDISSDLKSSFGIERILTQQAYQLQNEFGSNGEAVYAITNDSKGLVRLVGSWSSVIDSSGQNLATTTTNDYVEMVFYGTGLNILLTPAASMDFRSTVDNGTESSNLALSYATLLTGRNYSPNVVISVASGLTLGVHTVKIRNNASAGIKFSGVEVLNTSSATSINVNSGIVFNKGTQVTTNAATLSAYNSGFTNTYGTAGSRGGRVLVYQDSSGNIKKDIQYTNTASANLSSADHTNEEIARVYDWREFGAGRSDDFSTVNSGTGSARAFTADDGSATLIANAANIGFTTPDAFNVGNTANNFFTLTFIGTGLDIVRLDSTTSLDTFTVSVDGNSIGNLSAIGTANLARTTKIISGLPYGTHTVKIARTTIAGNPTNFVQFIVYQPKTPALPSGSTQLAAYNLMANYVATSSGTIDSIGSGLLRKVGAVRETTFIGTGFSGPTLTVGGVASGFQTYIASTSGSSGQYVFFGTGIELRLYANATAVNNSTVTIDGATNFTTSNSSPTGGSGWSGALTTNLVQTSTGATFTASTGVIGGTNAANNNFIVQISGMTLGWHTVKITTNSTANIYFDTWDIITPIHSHSSSLPYDEQNSLPIGSQCLADLRAVSPIKDTGLQKKNISQAFGMISGPTTSSTSFIPCPDMSVVHTNTTGKIKVSTTLVSSNTATTADNYFQVFINGNPAGITSHAVVSSSAGNTFSMSLAETFNVSPGTHKIDIYWKVSSGTATVFGTDRNLLVEEI